MTINEWRGRKSRFKHCDRPLSSIAAAMAKAARKHGWTDVAAMYEGVSGKMRVWRHANFKRSVPSADAQLYIEISKKKITLADLLKRPVDA